MGRLMAANRRSRPYKEVAHMTARQADPRAVQLKCGHETRLHPLAVLGARKLYVCPKGCHDLQEPKR